MIPTLCSVVILIFWLKLVRTVKLNIFPYRKMVYITYILHYVPLKNVKQSLYPLSCSISYGFKQKSYSKIYTERKNVSVPEPRILWILLGRHIHNLKFCKCSNERWFTECLKIILYAYVVLPQSFSSGYIIQWNWWQHAV